VIYEQDCEIVRKNVKASGSYFCNQLKILSTASVSDDILK